MAKIVISLMDRKLYFYLNNYLYGVYDVAIGRPETPTPIGEFRIIEKTINPGGGLGTRWMGFTRERHGIHGNNSPAPIGAQASAGCVRMNNHDVESIYPHAPMGTPVIVKDFHRDSGGYYEHSPEAEGYTKNASSPVKPSRPNISNTTKGTFYTVRAGDSLWSIAKRFGVNVHQLKSYNNISSDLIFPGQTIRIPK